MTRAPRASAPRQGAGGGNAGDNADQGELPFDAPPRPAKSAGKPGQPKRKTAKTSPAAASRGKGPAKRAGKTGGKGAGKASGAAPTGFGGWLWLLAIGQLIVTARLIDTLRRMAGLIGTELWTDHPQLVSVDLALYGLALVLQLLVLGAMVLRSRNFRPLFLIAIVAFFLIGRIEPLLAITVLGMDPAGLLTRETLVPLGIELIVSLVWGAYVLKSQRVANTFVR